MKWLYIVFLAVLLTVWFIGCTSRQFNWNNYCSPIKECPPNKWCFIDMGPDGEPYQYGQCIKNDN